MTELKTNKDWALMYQQKGFSIVPVVPNEKRPAIAHAGRKPLTAEDIRNYWDDNFYDGTTHGNSNYGIAWKMNDIFSIDVDTVEHSGTTKIDGLATFRKELLARLPTGTFNTLTAKTPSGGLHFYFRKQNGLPNKSKAGLFAGIDIQAESGNISIVPPTVRNGTSYKWLSNDYPIIDASPALIELLQEQLQPSRGRKFSTSNFHQSGQATTWTGKLLEEIYSPQSVGTRNDYIAHLTGKVLSSGCTPATAYQVVLDANSRFTPPLDEKEVNRTFMSIYNRRKRELHE